MKMSKIIMVIVGLLALGGAFAVGMSFEKKNQLATQAQTGGQQSSPTQTQGRAKTGSAVLLGKIESVKTKGNAGEVAFRLVEWVSGDDNVEQAKFEAGECSLQQIENDECAPEPFFVRNTEKRVMLPTSSSIHIRLLTPSPSGEVSVDKDGNVLPRDASLSGLMKMSEIPQYKGTPFVITTTHGVITDIQERYTP